MNCPFGAGRDVFVADRTDILNAVIGNEPNTPATNKKADLHRLHFLAPLLVPIAIGIEPRTP